LDDQSPLSRASLQVCRSRGDAELRRSIDLHTLLWTGLRLTASLGDGDRDGHGPTARGLGGLLLLGSSQL
jgi:hypothetical protein